MRRLLPSFFLLLILPPLLALSTPSLSRTLPVTSTLSPAVISANTHSLLLCHVVVSRIAAPSTHSTVSVAGRTIIALSLQEEGVSWQGTTDARGDAAILLPRGTGMTLVSLFEDVEGEGQTEVVVVRRLVNVAEGVTEVNLPIAIDPEPTRKIAVMKPQENVAIDANLQEDNTLNTFITIENAPKEEAVSLLSMNTATSNLLPVFLSLLLGLAAGCIFVHVYGMYRKHQILVPPCSTPLPHTVTTSHGTWATSKRWEGGGCAAAAEVCGDEATGALKKEDVKAPGSENFYYLGPETVRGEMAEEFRLEEVETLEQLQQETKYSETIDEFGLKDVKVWEQQRQGANIMEKFRVEDVEAWEQQRQSNDMAEEFRPDDVEVWEQRWERTECANPHREALDISPVPSSFFVDTKTSLDVGNVIHHPETYSAFPLIAISNADHSLPPLPDVVPSVPPSRYHEIWTSQSVPFSSIDSGAPEVTHQHVGVRKRKILAVDLGPSTPLVLVTGDAATPAAQKDEILHDYLLRMGLEAAQDGKRRKMGGACFAAVAVPFQPLETEF